MRVAEKVARYRHAQLSAIKLAGDINAKNYEDATLDEVFARLKVGLFFLHPLLRPLRLGVPLGPPASGREKSSLLGGTRQPDAIPQGFRVWGPGWPLPLPASPPDQTLRLAGCRGHIKSAGRGARGRPPVRHRLIDVVFQAVIMRGLGDVVVLNLCLAGNRSSQHWRTDLTTTIRATLT
jgi:hypothetical protein